MAAPFAIPAVTEGVRNKLVADTAVTSLIAVYAPGFGTGPGIYPEGGVPPKAAFPYITLGAAVAVPFNTMGDSDESGGSNCTLQAKVLSAKMRKDEAYAIGAKVKDSLDGKAITVAGYASSDCQTDSEEDAYPEIVSGVTIWHLPMIFRVYVHQSA